MLHHAHSAGGTVIATALLSAGMMMAMMAPTVAPWIAAVHRLGLPSLRWESRVWTTALFASGYFAIWAVFGVVLAGIDWLVGVPTAYDGLILVGAGLFQLTSLKQACLTHCRSPLSFLLVRWKNGPDSAFRLGLSHAAYCVGCCWALMLTSLAVGVMSLWWMAGLAATTLAEQATPWGARLRMPIGVALIGVGIWRW